MRKQIFYSISILILFFLSACGPTVQDAIDYNDKIIDQELAVIGKIDILEKEFTTYQPEKIEPALKSAVEQIKISIDEVEKIEAFDGSTEFKDQTLEFLRMFKKQLENDYPELLRLYKLPTEEYTETEENRYNEVATKIDTEYEAAFKKFNQAQENFAKKYNFQLQATK